MKKIGSLLLAVLMVLSLAACGKAPAEPTQMSSAQPGTEAPATEATEPAPAYAMDTLTVGTTAAIETAGVAERQAIADAILQTSIDGNQGKLYVDEYHDLVHKVIIARNNGKTPEALTVITEY